MSLERTIYDHGILHPNMTVRAANKAGLKVYIACAFLMQETAGGSNIYGHDVEVVKLADGTDKRIPRPFWGHGVVTEANYNEYLVERDLGIREADRWPTLGRRSQGVGPMQLTFYAFQDEADKAGGCWDAEVNMYIGFKIIQADIRAGKSLWRAAKEYNGKDSYANRMAIRFTEWKSITGGA